MATSFRLYRHYTMYQCTAILDKTKNASKVTDVPIARTPLHSRHLRIRCTIPRQPGLHFLDPWFSKTRAMALLQPKSHRSDRRSTPEIPHPVYHLRNITYIIMFKARACPRDAFRPADFDFTMTKFWLNGRRGNSCHQVIGDCGLLSEEYHAKTSKLRSHYYPFEVWFQLHRVLVGITTLKLVPQFTLCTLSGKTVREPMWLVSSRVGLYVGPPSRAIHPRRTDCFESQWNDVQTFLVQTPVTSHLSDTEHFNFCGTCFS